MSRPRWHDTYAGQRWTYGLTYRPVGYAQIPDGWILKSDRPHRDFQYGTIDYPFELSPRLVEAFKLTLVEC